MMKVIMQNMKTKYYSALLNKYNMFFASNLPSFLIFIRIEYIHVLSDELI